jgi:hypothetical protein
MTSTTVVAGIIASGVRMVVVVCVLIVMTMLV